MNLNSNIDAEYRTTVRNGRKEGGGGSWNYGVITNAVNAQTSVAVNAQTSVLEE